MFIGGLLADWYKLAAVISQRCLWCVGLVYVLHPANEDDVIARHHVLVRAALQGCHRARYQRHAAQACLYVQASKAVFTATGKPHGQCLLVVGQYVNSEVAGMFKGLQGARVLVYAPQHQRRRERDGVKRVDCKTNVLALLVACGDYGDASCKLGQSLLE